MSETPGYKIQAPSSPSQASSIQLTFSTPPAAAQATRKAAEKLAMEYGYPYNGCGGNKEKRPPLKRGQLKLQIARTLLGSIVAPGAKNRDRSFGR
ncbi:hypothetical protein C2845_PM07G27680 [Panicum miliaceum]|uniref:Uncharacterized protein n=1 Tax=Panicum miliaceum TaxID=4540 RepID=A0A3L6SJ09_PANMI|nr:hypothetical protein C2845_PM07G27680 [Panicum miliaceum]